MAFVQSDSVPFAPFFQLFNDLDSGPTVFGCAPAGRPSGPHGRHHRGGRGGRGGAANHGILRPRFDVRETDNAYELQGELPGFQRDQIHLEFDDQQGLVISGHIEGSFEAGDNGELKQLTTASGNIKTLPAETDTASPSRKATVEEDGQATETDSASPSRKATVGEDGQATDTGAVAATPATETNSQVTQRKQPKYWLTERIFGDFSRTFTFPFRVEEEGVTANFKDGVLKVVVPKARKTEGRRIAIN